MAEVADDNGCGCARPRPVARAQALGTNRSPILSFSSVFAIAVNRILQMPSPRVAPAVVDAFHLHSVIVHSNQNDRRTLVKFTK